MSPSIQRDYNAVLISRIGPSLFAFHGSPIANWHSIIREGLNFIQTLHGRAYGHGCYHSLHLATSMGYSASNSSGVNLGSLIWPQSELKITSALSLNEIVNSPDEFVSKVSANAVLFAGQC